MYSLRNLGQSPISCEKAFIGKDAAPLPPAHKAFWVI